MKSVKVWVLFFIVVAVLGASVPSLGMNIPVYISKNISGNIYQAIENGDVQLVKQLINSGVDVNSCKNIVDLGRLGKLNKRETPLLLACRKSDQKMVELLLKKGAGKSVFSADRYGKTPIFAAIENGDFDIFKLLFAYYKEFVNERFFYGKTLFCYACEKDRRDIISFLLDNGAEQSVHECDYIFRSPLYWACKNDNLDLVRFLLQKESVRGSILIACFDKVNDRDERLLPIWWACKKNNPESVKLLLEKAPEPCIMSYLDGLMPLKPAIKNGSAEVVRLLLGHGVSVIEEDVVLAQSSVAVHDRPELNRQERQEVLRYLEVAKECDTRKDWMRVMSGYEQDEAVYNFLVKRSFARKYKSTFDVDVMFGTLKKQLSGVNSAGVNNCKKIRDCVVRCVNL
jgi:FOG: Ankyrin repeat